MNIKQIAFLTSFVVVLSLVAVGFSMSGPQSESPALQEISQSPRITELWEVHLDSISLFDAQDRAGFTFGLPDNLPANFSVRHAIYEKSDDFETYKGERFTPERVTLMLWDQELPDRVTYQDVKDGGSIWLMFVRAPGENTTAPYEGAGYDRLGEIQFLWGYPAVVSEGHIEVFQFEEALVYHVYGQEYEEGELLAIMESLIRG